MKRIINKIKYIEKHSELQVSDYCDGITGEPIFKRRLINEEMWQELKGMIEEVNILEDES